MTQEYDDFEVLVLLDGPRQAEIVRAVSQVSDDARIRIVPSDGHLGPAKNHERGFDLAAGKYAAIINDDDEWTPGFLSTLVPALDDDNEIVIAFCDHWIIDGRGSLLEDATVANSELYGRTTLSGGKNHEIEQLAVISQTIPLAQASVFRMDALSALHIPRRVGSMWDLYISFQLARTHLAVYYASERLTKYRVHDDSLTAERSLAKAWEAVACYGRIVGDREMRTIKRAALGKYVNACKGVVGAGVRTVLGRRTVVARVRRTTPGSRLTWLPPDSPRSHRLAHELARAGFRGHRYYWRLAHRLSRLPLSPSIQIGTGNSLSLPLVSEDLVDIQIYRGTYERAELSVASRFAAPGTTCVDVGANIGLYTLFLASLVGPKGRVVAFEPSVATRRRLEDVSAALPCVTVLPFALGARESVEQLAQLDGTHAWSTLRPDDSPGTAFSEVRVRRLDSIEELQGSGPLELVKVDVEGWESHVLEGAVGLLTSGRIGALLIEVNPDWDDTGYVHELVNTHGYLGFEVGLRSTGTRLRQTPALYPLVSSKEQRNVLLVRGDRLRLVADLIVPSPTGPSR